ncbi:MAG: hypothetical protein R2726_16035 [Acidimicrobiales bacterium]
MTRSLRSPRFVLLALALALVAAPLAGCALFDKKVDVLLIGDSIMNQSAPAVQDQLRLQPGLEDIKVHTEAVNGSGLMTPGVYDWLGEAQGLIDTYQPKIVVVLFVGNYTDTDLFVGADGTPIPNDYGQRFYAEWGRQAATLTTTLQSKGAQVYWVLPPPFLSDEGARRNNLMRQTYVDLARAKPGVGLVDGRQALGGPQGEFEWKLPGIDGKDVTVRQGDSLHLSEEGGELMARKIAFDIGPTLVEIRRAQATA